VLDYNIVFNPLPSGAASYIALGKKRKIGIYINFIVLKQPATLPNSEVRLERKVNIGLGKILLSCGQCCQLLAEISGHPVENSAVSKVENSAVSKKSRAL
jgi:hypothetical protein